jgi:hypothetical protein
MSKEEVRQKSLLAKLEWLQALVLAHLGSTSTILSVLAKLGSAYTFAEKLPRPFRWVALGTLGLVIAVVATAVLITVGFIVLAMVANSLPSSSLNSAQQTQLNALMGTILGAWPLLVVVVIVMIAGIIIGAFFVFFRSR